MAGKGLDSTDGERHHLTASTSPAKPVEDSAISDIAKIWYFNVGEAKNGYDDGTNRNWEDNRDLGFISAGRLEKSSREIRRLAAGDSVYVYLSRHGYVGFGTLLADPIPARELVLPDGRQLRDVSLRESSVLSYDPASDPGLAEWAAPVRWVRTFARSEAKSYSGIFSFPGAACRLTNSQTLEFLAAEFGVPTLSPARSPHVWVEKTIVEGRPDRQIGENRLGAALWSPKRSKHGADIYRFMRDVTAGDIILHLTDNRGFTGISQAEASAEDFGGVPDTEWGADPSYRIRLTNYAKLDPPLPRETIFASPFRERLIELIDNGQKNLFYNSAPALNQGAYLTPAPAALVRILNDAYRNIAGRSLIGTSHEERSTPIKQASDDAAAFDRLVKTTYWTESALSAIIGALRHPIKPARQIILAGPPGTSKTFVAQQLVKYLTRGDQARSHLVQFHPSYSYEQFVEGLRPTAVDGTIEFKPEPGIVLELAEKCRSSADDHFLVIDEFNRANLSRVLGELMFLFEYRDHTIDLPYTRNFSLPPNLTFIATMNTADRNIRSIDLALRRRFEVFDCPPNPALLERYYAQGGPNQNDVVGLADGLAKLNDRLAAELDEHHTIGHAFFMSRHLTLEDLANIWQRKIRPLLSEYFFASPDMVYSFDLATFWPSAK
jgi:hypothetical protein